jgi:hypothetical protein
VAEWSALYFKSAFGGGDVIALRHYNVTAAVMVPQEVRHVVGALVAALDPERREDLLREMLAGGPPDASGVRPWEPVVAAKVAEEGEDRG